MSGIWPRSATTPWNWSGGTGGASTLVSVPITPQPDDPISPADIRAFLRTYRSAKNSVPWLGVEPEPVAAPNTPHARVEAWLERLGEV